MLGTATSAASASTSRRRRASRFLRPGRRRRRGGGEFPPRRARAAGARLGGARTRVIPRLVWAAISGFGQTGPYREPGGFDLMVQAMSGLMSVTGPKDGPPYRIPLAISDVGAGVYRPSACWPPFEARQKTGAASGSRLRCSKPLCHFGVYEAAQYFANGTGRPSSARPIAAPRPTGVPDIGRLAHHRRRAAEFLQEALRHDRQIKLVPNPGRRSQRLRRPTSEGPGRRTAALSSHPAAPPVPLHDGVVLLP